jgi:hypothetical protein
MSAAMACADMTASMADVASNLIDDLITVFLPVGLCFRSAGPKEMLCFLVETLGRITGH